MLNYDGRYLLIYLAVKYQGDYNKILFAIETKEDVPYEEALKTYQSLKCKCLTILDYDYPLKLKNSFQPPFVLFYYGDISLLHQKRIIAAVGSRKSNEVGEQAVKDFMIDLAPGNVVVSGLAKGIDACAHIHAIKNRGRTIAVLGSGIDYPYPLKNEYLYNIIKNNHLLISEYPGSTVPGPTNFPARNRIIVALSDCVFVPQINEYASGTMISINLAANLGKPVIIAPHPYGSKTINNRIIDEGAIIAIDGKQIKEELQWKD